MISLFLFIDLTWLFLLTVNLNSELVNCTAAGDDFNLCYHGDVDVLKEIILCDTQPLILN